MPNLRLDASMEPDARQEVFQRTASGAFAPLQITPLDAIGFKGHVHAEQAGGLLVADIRAKGCTVQRTPRLITSTDNEVYKFALQLDGKALISQDGRQCAMGPGDMVVYDSTRPYVLEHPDAYRTVVIGCPRAYLAPHAKDLAEISAVIRPSDTGVCRLVAGFLGELANELGGTVEEGGIHLADSLLDMITMVFVGQTNHREDARSPLLNRIIAYCEARIADPGLSVQSIAQAHGISVSYLHKLFGSRDQSVTAWIRSRRVERIRRDLENPLLANRTMAAIAASWGLLDTAHISRLFRAAYGVSAAEYRREALHLRQASGQASGTETPRWGAR